MKFTAWRTWLWNRLGRFLRPKRPRTLATAGCIALGLATAWGEAEADIAFKVEVTPAHDLLDAFVYYGNNSTGGGIFQMGPIKAGDTYTLVQRYPGVPGTFVDDTPKYYEDGGSFPAGFGVGGIYEREDGFGLALSLPTDSPIETRQSWEGLFDLSDSPISGLVVIPSEQEVVDEYLEALEDTTYRLSETSLKTIYQSYTTVFNYYELNEHLREQQHVTAYGKQATLISFRDTRFAGTAIVTIVPEPQSVFYVVAFACMALATSSNRLFQGRAQ
ncbi:hypothetical protein [Aeoliella sp.]|uniref:hypothetical protein n=1 Tax=Aeoliella sp. TaxID=2795800 RepID=UPI003CCC033F